MNLYTKDNSRRFFRQNLELKFSILPKKLSTTRIYSNGVSYFNQATEDDIAYYKNLIIKQLSQVEHHQTILKKIVGEIFNAFDLTMANLKALGEGKDIKKSKAFLMGKIHVERGFQSVALLKGQADKTHELFKRMEERFLTYAGFVFSTTENSTDQKVHFDSSEDIFYFKTTIKQGLEKQKIDVNKSHLLRMIVLLEELMAVAFKPYTNLVADYLLARNNKVWLTQEVNASACGFGIYDKREYEFLQWVDIRVNLDDFNEILEFEAKVVRKHYDKKRREHFVALDFYFPDSRYQKELMGFIQLMEIKNAMKDNGEG